MIPVPARVPIEYRIRRYILRGIMIVAVVMVAVSIAAWIAAYRSSVTVDRDRPYVWRSGSAVFLAGFWVSTVNCTVSHDGRDDAVRLPPSDKLEVRGARITRQSATPATITCDHEVRLSSGPVLLLYRPASWPDTVPLCLTALLLIPLLRWRERSGIDAANRLWRQARYLTKRRRLR